jgi:dihydrofolate reductase
MGQLIYGPVTMSIDGYIADADGKFDWARPSDEVHAFVNEHQRSVGTHLYGRRMYETMQVWETLHEHPDAGPVVVDFAAIWQAADKVVYSTTLDDDGITTARTRLERRFDPDAVRSMKDEADQDLAIAGPHLGAAAIAAGLVDEYHLFVVPAVVGGGNRALPDGVRLDLDLVDQRRFAAGTAFLRYRRRDA